ncbi:MAG: response regulator transcription factor [Elusimicrobiota bacterium]|jgi:DNA-binding response OmpR family regulator
MKSAGYRILVVEDEQDWSDIVRLWLKTAGYTNVEIVCSGAAALKSVRKDPPDCIILDLQLSDQDGTLVCRRIREMPRARATPIVMMTNYPGEKVLCLRSGADYFVAKSPNGNELLATLEAVFRRRDMDAGLMRVGDLAFQPDTYELFLDGRPAAKLTPKTYELMLILVRRSPSPIGREELFHLVDNREDPAISRALDILMNRLRKSLPEILRRRIRAVRGFGYTYIPPTVPLKSVEKTDKKP